MSKRLLVIDRDDQGRFSLAIHGGTLTIGASAAEAEVVLRDLHVSHLHCEIEVAEDLVFADNPEIGGVPRELRPGAALHAGLTHLRFLADAPVTAVALAAGAISDDGLGLALDDADIAAPQESATPEAAPTRLRFRFHVVDGADRGRLFALPDSGQVTVGKSHKDADVVLNDLYVSRVHCELEVEADHLLVRHVEGQSGTLVDGKQVKEQQIYPGAVLRIGNTHLRLESFEDIDARPSHAAAASADTVDEIGDAEEAFEIVDEVIAIASADTDEKPGESSGDTFALPHSPVDELLDLEGQTFGHFKIETLLGRGQSGLVFRAVDLKTKQTVALKVLAADFPACDAELSRFVSAVKLASSIHHPGLVTIFGAGKSGEYCWLSKEYLAGENLSRRIRRLHEGGKPDWKAACRVAVHLATLLDYLHRHKVAHGNITPRNVLIRSSDHATKLADLMLNRTLEGSKLQKDILANKQLAELPYTAPEQTNPHAPATPLGDIYSLGAVLYAVLTGKAPFTGETRQTILAQIGSGKVVPPSKLQRGIPALFETAVLMMMARRPEERFQTAAHLLEAVESFAQKHDVEV